MSCLISKKYVFKTAPAFVNVFASEHVDDPHYHSYVMLKIIWFFGLFVYLIIKKTCIRETPNISTYVDISTDIFFRIRCQRAWQDMFLLFITPPYTR